MSKIKRSVYNVGLVEPDDELKAQELYERASCWWNTNFETIEDCDIYLNDMCEEYGINDAMDMITKVGTQLGHL